MKKKAIIIFMPYPHGKSPSQRFRFEQYLDILIENDFEYSLNSFYSEKTWEILHWEGHTFSKISRVLKAFIVRFYQVFKAIKYDYVFIHREVAPVGPPFLEWILAKLFRKKIIYDFDDAIWLPNYSEANTKFQKLKCYSKVNGIMKMAAKISVGNQYLAEYARQFNENVKINPTTIDTENYHNPKFYKHFEFQEKIVVGWTGTHTTAKYLDFLVPIIEKLTIEFDFEFCVISNEEPTFQMPNLKFIKWEKDTEIEDLMQFTIGVMPLTDDQWAKGKCGFKALQYMALGIPAIASPIGVNNEIIDHGKNGFLCSTEKQWHEALYYLLENPEETKKMHENARKKIIENYSVESNKRNFLNLFSDL
ncbi:MAG: glycosyltransferase family 4 protein [Flavobacteriia bacterium]|nr:glycosyltransferase family 4 protein [Flavobacteriia bacterium]